MNPSTDRAVIFRVEGDSYRPAGGRGFSALDSDRRATLESRAVFPPVRARADATGRAIADSAVVHIRDLAAVPEAELPSEVGRALGVRTQLVVPLLRDGVAIGAINLSRREVHPFTEQQIALVQTFADQAVIAMENARLFQELQDRNRALTERTQQLQEALEQQTATADILRVIASSPTNLQPVLHTVVENAARLCGADNASIRLVEGATLRLVANHWGAPPPEVDPEDWRRVQATLHVGQVLPIFDHPTNFIARAFAERRPIYEPDTWQSRGEDHAASRGGLRAIVNVPLLREGAPIGALAIRSFRPHAFSSAHLKLLETFADQAVIAIENTRLFRELEDRNRDLTEALEQQTATAEVLEAISRAPTDLQQVLDTIADSAARLCGTERAMIWQMAGDGYRAVAGLTLDDRRYTLESGSVIPLARARDYLPGRAITDGVVVHVPDLAAVPEAELPAPRARAWGMRTNLAVPLLRQGVAIGAIGLGRREVRPFTDQQIALLETFADQAVIAIENARLFTELQESNRTLTEALEQQTAAAGIVGVVLTAAAAPGARASASAGRAWRPGDATGRRDGGQRGA